MRKSILCLLLSLTLLLMAACSVSSADSPEGDGSGSAPPPSSADGSGSGDTDTSGTAEQPSGQSSGDGFVFTTAWDEDVAVDDDMKDVLERLGEPQKYFEAASCAFEGLDKTYTYSGFVIVTRPDGEEDYVNSIRLTDDSAATREGAYIGCTADYVSSIYGEGERTDTLLYYEKGDTSLNFVLENGKVTSIEYLTSRDGTQV